MEARQCRELVAGDWYRGHQAQIKSRRRIRDLAEVYTHEREVNAMLDLVPGMFPSARYPANTDCSFLEPACGHGNFLVEILRRKLKYVTPRRYGRGERFEHRALRCLVSIYGLDISEENVRKSRERVRSVISAQVKNYLGADGPTTGFSDAVEAILETNIVRCDTLADAGEIELVEYRPESGGTFTREWSRLDPAGNELNLFALAPRRDQAPVHYSDLRENPCPVAHDAIEGEAA
jgi:SAM-dependent methyltransferase